MIIKQNEMNICSAKQTWLRTQERKKKASAIRNIKKTKQQNQCFLNFRFHQGTGISTHAIDRIQIPKSWKTMQDYEEDAEFN